MMYGVWCMVYGVWCMVYDRMYLAEEVVSILHTCTPPMLLPLVPLEPELPLPSFCGEI
jgi:hypothetical protein